MNSPLAHVQTMCNVITSKPIFKLKQEVQGAEVSTIIEDITQNYRLRQAFAIACYCVDLNDQRISLTTCLFRSTIVQLLVQSTCVFGILENLNEKHQNHGKNSLTLRLPPFFIIPLMDEFMECLRQTADGFHYVYMIINALGKCSKRYGLLQFVSNSVGRRTTKIHFLMTSRDQSNPEQILPDKQHTLLKIKSTLVDTTINHLLRDNFEMIRGLENGFQR